MTDEDDRETGVGERPNEQQLVLAGLDPADREHVVGNAVLLGEQARVGAAKRLQLGAVGNQRGRPLLAVVQFGEPRQLELAEADHQIGGLEHLAHERRVVGEPCSGDDVRRRNPTLARRRERVGDPPADRVGPTRARGRPRESRLGPKYLVERHVDWREDHGHACRSNVPQLAERRFGLPHVEYVHQVVATRLTRFVGRDVRLDAELGKRFPHRRQPYGRTTHHVPRLGGVQRQQHAQPRGLGDHRPCRPCGPCRLCRPRPGLAVGGQERPILARTRLT